MNVIALSAIVDLAAAQALAETLKAEPIPFAIDGSGVERIGVAGLQLLLSARAASDSAGHLLTIDRPSAALKSAAATAGAGFLLAAN